MRCARALRRGLAALAISLLAGCAAPPPAAPVKVTVLAINDFHGNLKAPPGGIRIQDPAHPDASLGVEAGGAEYLATAIAELRARNPHHVFVAAGDLIGASPLLSALFHDEPTVESLSLMGLEASAVGNHEFDKGAAELLRMQRGGCHPVDGCQGPRTFEGAAWQYLAASTVDLKTGRTLLPAYHVKVFEGIPVAFIGLTLKGTPGIVVPAGVAGLEFRDEARTVNALVPELQRQGIEAIVVLIHEGGYPVGDYNECPGISGPIVDIVRQLDRAVQVVISGHTHRAYNCRIDGRLVTSGDKYGTIVTAIELVLDRATRRIASASADNLIVRHTAFAPEPRQTALIAEYEQRARPLTRRVVGRIGAALTLEPSAAGETALGQVIADAQLEATRGAGAQLALMNPGGIRAALQLPADGLLHFEDLYSCQPFDNALVTLTLSGAQLLRLLEQQWAGSGGSRVMQVSGGFSYRWDGARPVGARVVPDSARLDGRAIDPGSSYRVTVNAFMAGGGDGFGVLKEGSERITGGTDVEALERYIAAHPGLRPDPQPRIARLN
jgi:5'-nucleotidase